MKFPKNFNLRLFLECAKDIYFPGCQTALKIPLLF